MRQSITLFCEKTGKESKNAVAHLRVTNICSLVLDWEVSEPSALDVLNKVANGCGTRLGFLVEHWLLGSWLGGVCPRVNHHEPSV